MRLIGVLKDEKQARNFTAFLAKEGIGNLCEASSNTDWGGAEYSDVDFKIWVYDENEIPRVRELWKEFQQNPDDPKFKVEHHPLKEFIEPPVSVGKETEQPPPSSLKKQQFWRQGRAGSLSVYLIVFCSLLFIVMEMMAVNRNKKLPAYIPYTVMTSADLKKQMLFDYPSAFELADNLVILYGVDGLREPQKLPPEGQELVTKYLQKKYWKGLYHEIVVNSDKKRFVWGYDGPLFKKIVDGQWWRLFTPALLHGDIFHLLFNMVWLAVLGTQMENRLGKLRYLLFIVVVAIISNVAQYLMSGFNFLGYSGVVCGMLGFIWIRQRIAPWEGYRLHSTTIAFITFFVLATLGLQIISFFLEVFHKTVLPIGIANTAHITGGLVGLAIGKLGILNKRKA